MASQIEKAKLTKNRKFKLSGIPENKFNYSLCAIVSQIAKCKNRNLRMIASMMII